MLRRETNCIAEIATGILQKKRLVRLACTADFSANGHGGNGQRPWLVMQFVELRSWWW